MSSLLSTEKQLTIRSQLRDTTAKMDAIRTGILDVDYILRWRLVCESFKTQDKDMLVMLEHAKLLSERDEPVLICGESGTGKEIVANILHGKRVGTPLHRELMDDSGNITTISNFVAVNTCAVTDTLFESELFGHVRGSFTGAEQDRQGLIAQAANGTLFLDEIGDMDIRLQAKLLRVIQNRIYRKVGSNKDEEVKCRIVAATHQDLPKLIKERQFRLDLYERLSVFTLHIKPLRHRKDDVKLLWPEHTIDLENEPLVGNVRQLLNMKLRKEVLGTV